MNMWLQLAVLSAPLFKGFSLEESLHVCLPQNLGVLVDRAVPLKRSPKKHLLSAVISNLSKHACDFNIMSGSLRTQAINAQPLSLTGTIPLIAEKRHFCMWVSCYAHVKQSLNGITLCVCVLDGGSIPQWFLLGRGVIQWHHMMKLMARVLWSY